MLHIPDFPRAHCSNPHTLFFGGKYTPLTHDQVRSAEMKFPNHTQIRYHAKIGTL